MPCLTFTPGTFRNVSHFFSIILTSSDAHWPPLTNIDTDINKTFLEDVFMRISLDTGGDMMKMALALELLKNSEFKWTIKA